MWTIIDSSSETQIRIAGGAFGKMVYGCIMDGLSTWGTQPVGLCRHACTQRKPSGEEA